MKLNMKSCNSININGKKYSGKNVSISGDRVIIDGKEHEPIKEKTINIVVEGDVDTIDNENGTITAYNVGSVYSHSGDINCDDIAGSANTMSGDITCKNIGGSAKTMSGDITGV